MSVSFDPTGDAVGVVDGGEQLTLYQRSTGAGHQVTCWRVEVVETYKPGVSCVTTLWGAQGHESDLQVEVGDVLVDSAQNASKVTRVEVKRSDARVHFSTGRHQLLRECSEHLDIERPRVDGDNGVTRWGTIVAAERGVVLAKNLVDRPAQSHSVIVLKDLDLQAGDRIFGHRSGYFRVLGPVLESSVDQPYEIAVERLQPRWTSAEA